MKPKNKLLAKAITYVMVVIIGKSVAFSQNIVMESYDCDMEDEILFYNPVEATLLLAEPLNYIPRGIIENNKLTHQPIKTIDVAIHVFQANDGHGNFQNTTGDIQFLKNMVTHLNEHYSYSVPTDPVPGCTQLPGYDSRIRFTLGDPGSERIYFYRDSTCYNEGSSQIVFQNYMNQHFPERLSGNVNIYLSQGYDHIKIKKIHVVNRGTGYTEIPKVKFQHNLNNFFEAEAFISNGGIDSIKIRSDSIYQDNWPADSLLPVAYLSGGNGNGAIISTDISLGANGKSSLDQNRIMLIRTKDNTDYERVASLLGHELGHLFELGHVWDSTICFNERFMGDIFGDEGLSSPKIWLQVKHKIKLYF